MRHLEPKEMSVTEIFSLITGGITPRPIALVATTSEDGHQNLAPFSFFNVFGVNPPYVAFSPSRKMHDGSQKDTYYNLKRTHECTIQLVTSDMVEQVNLTSADYPHGLNEFSHCGLTPIPSDLVTSPRVKESPFQMECVLDQIIELGKGKGSGNLMICEVVKFHVVEEIFRNNMIDPDLLDVVGRSGGRCYTRNIGEALFEVERPKSSQSLGFKKLPDFILKSQVLTANNLAQLAGYHQIPNEEEVADFILCYEPQKEYDPDQDLSRTFEHYCLDQDYHQMITVAIALKHQKHPLTLQILERTAQMALHFGDQKFAWKTLIYASL